MIKRIKISKDCYMEVDVEIYKKNKNVLNLEFSDGERERCRICELEEVWVIIPERLVLDGKDN